MTHLEKFQEKLNKFSKSEWFGLYTAIKSGESNMIYSEFVRGLEDMIYGEIG